MKIKRNDLVVILSGKERGMTGRVLSVDPVKERAYVEGRNIVQKHKKALQQDDEAGIIPKEAPIHVSNLALYSEKVEGPVRVRARFIGQSGELFERKKDALLSFEVAPERIKKVRFAKKTGEIFD